MSETVFKRLMHEDLKSGYRIRMTVWKGHGTIIMGLQEYEVDKKDPQWESFTLFQSWRQEVAKEDHKRVTQKILSDFISRNTIAAEALVAKRVIERETTTCTG